MSGARIPADVDREDRLLAGLSARQLLELAVAVVVALMIRTATTGLPLALSAALVAVPLLLGAAVALGRHDGLPADRLALAWFKHRGRPRLLVAAPEGVLAPPAGFRTVRLPAPLCLPTQPPDADGVLDLGDSGAALICKASALNFGLRTEEEQKALVAVLARWLNSLEAAVQILIHTEPVDVGTLIGDIEAGAAGLPHADLEQAARDHARFLAALSDRRNVLRREVLLVFHTAARTDEVAESLLQRADAATSSLAAAGIVVERLDEAAARSVLARCATPDDPAPPSVLAWASGDVVSGVEAR